MPPSLPLLTLSSFLFFAIHVAMLYVYVCTCVCFMFLYSMFRVLYVMRESRVLCGPRFVRHLCLRLCFMLCVTHTNPTLGHFSNIACTNTLLLSSSGDCTDYFALFFSGPSTCIYMCTYIHILYILHAFDVYLLFSYVYTCVFRCFFI